MVKALDLRSNVRMHTWVRTPSLVWGPSDLFSFFFSLRLSSNSSSTYGIELIASEYTKRIASKRLYRAQCLTGER